ncbi:MAG: 4-(cytidine 5'-diphospho)-2-C-methyl-D-erythritol kinase [Parcubacteria group bacterium]|nr:4-(cytidine 5'-diphospho)-2-C-methyl-D-erythritol kinase [Parcubacteria group bacterium]
MKIKAPAKINLTLDILGKLPNDYHELTTVYQAVDLYDELDFQENESGDIKIASNSEQIPLDENNIVYKAAELIRQRHDIKKGVDIHIDKKIPVAAGLAGGSTDGAATLKALNEMWELKLPDEVLREYGTELGMDVPFLISGGTALGMRRGEKVRSLKNNLSLQIIIVTPEIAISTKEAYGSLDLAQVGQESEKTKRMIAALTVSNLTDVIDNLHNDFEKSIITQHSVIGEVKGKMLALGALGSLMSGSGPSVFGVWAGREGAEKAYKALRQEYKQAYLVKSL